MCLVHEGAFEKNRSKDLSQGAPSEAHILVSGDVGKSRQWVKEKKQTNKKKQKWQREIPGKSWQGMTGWEGKEYNPSKRYLGAEESRSESGWNA